MIKKLIALLHRRQDDWNRGTLTLEIAFAAPILVVAAQGAADIGAMMNTAASLRGATRAGAEYAKANWNNPLVTNPTTGTEQQVCGFLGLTLSSGTCSPITPAVTTGVATSCTCDDNTSVSPCPPSAGNPCSASNPLNPGVIEYVTVTAQQNFTPILSWASFVFPAQVQASTKMRTQ
jgi:Flp pilus assembly protein TadG